ncbi:uncharacterized protein LOC134711350 [Mytilus trossulus]|uniref:uncharacterized protein LOC134711350 n=1 Tax=Mytilus trossulus TaxID=6551 RepID=UPI003007641D
MATVGETPVSYDNSMDVSRIGNSSLQEECLLKLWNEYITESLIESTPCEIGIYEWKNNRTIVTTKKFKISAEELDHIKDGMECPNIVYRKGVTVDGYHYNVQVADGKYGIYSRTLDKGCTVCKTFSMLIIATNGNGVKSSKCNEEIMKLGDYLQRLGL